jgi:hypothetical protein
MVFYLKSTQRHLESTGRKDYFNDIDDSSVLILNPHKPDEKDQSLLKSMVQNHTSAISHVFLRILPYLNGRYDVDEIIYRESITRKELKSVVKYFTSFYFQAIIGTKLLLHCMPIKRY